MKNLGIVRQLDELGRVQLSILVKDLGIEGDSTVDIWLANGKIHIKKSVPRCIFCESVHNLTEYNHHMICSSCRSELAEGH